MRHIFFPSPKVYRRILLCCVCFLILVGASRSAPSSEELYKQGYNSFQTGDYLTAIEYLFAYNQMSSSSQDPDFKKKIKDAVLYSEEQVKKAIRIKEELEKYGEVKSITIKGKADDPSGHEITIPFRAPRAPAMIRPELPLSPTSRIADSQSAPRVKGSITETAKLDRDVTAHNEAVEKELAELREQYQLLKEKFEQCQHAKKKY